MAHEIERKFLVADPAWRDDAASAAVLEIAQAYLCAGVETSVRVRIIDNAATLTIKGPTRGYTRAEYEYAIPVDDARGLLPLCTGFPITKRRYVLDVGGKEWIVDEFSGENAGLIVAEIEFDDESDTFPRPAWLREEVSHRPEYFNANLATHPYSAW
jgi:adenylate cyclase